MLNGLAKILLRLFCIMLLTVMISSCLSDSDPASENTNNNGNNNSVSGTIVANNNVVDQYDRIPQEYIDIVKTWLVDAAGESHSAAYRTGMDALEDVYSSFQVNTFSGSIPAATSSALRLGRHGSVGEEDFWTNTAALDTIQDLIADQHNAGNPIHVIFQAWCWDLTRTTGAVAGGTNDYS